MSDERDAEFARDVKAVLDRGVRELDAVDREALARARARAVAAADRGGGLAWRPVAGLALAASVALVAVLVWRQAPNNALPVDATGDFEMLVSGEDLPLYEDLDFYLWLDAALDEAT